MFEKSFTLKVIIFFLLIFTILDCKKDTEVNEFNKLLNINPYLTSDEKCIFTNTSDEKRLSAIENAIKILNETNPKVADWIKDKIKNNKLIFTNDDAGYYAKFDFINKNLYVNKSIFVENDGIIAVTFAHEYRHSRQGYTKFIKYTISHLFYNKGNCVIL